MIKLIPKFNISSFKFLPKFTLKSKPKQYIADKPYVAYMSSSFYEPEEKNKSFSQEDLIKNLTKAFIKFKFGIDLDKKSEQVSQTTDNTLNETISPARSETISNSYEETEIKTHKKHKKKHKVEYSDYSLEDSTAAKVLKGFGKVIFAPVLLPIWGGKYIIDKIDDKIWEKKYYKAQAAETLARAMHEREELEWQKNLELMSIVQNNPILKKTLGEELYNKISSKEKFSMEQAENLVKQCNESLNIYSQLQNEIALELERYKKMFSLDDLLPDLSMFMPNAFKNLSLEELKERLNVLKACISHQDIINNLKNKYLNGAKSYISNKEAENITNMKIENDGDLNIKNGDTYRNKLNRMCMAFLKESKSIEAPILDFHNVSTKFFFFFKKNKAEIFVLKEKG